MICFRVWSWAFCMRSNCLCFCSNLRLDHMAEPWTLAVCMCVRVKYTISRFYTIDSHLHGRKVQMLVYFEWRVHFPLAHTHTQLISFYRRFNFGEDCYAEREQCSNASLHLECARQCGVDPFNAPCHCGYTNWRCSNWGNENMEKHGHFYEAISNFKFIAIFMNFWVLPFLFTHSSIPNESAQHPSRGMGDLVFL